MMGPIPCERFLRRIAGVGHSDDPRQSAAIRLHNGRATGTVPSRLPTTYFNEADMEAMQGMEDNNHVSIVDVKMPFLSMVVFMVKAAVAAIPAMIILAIIGSVITAIFGGLSGGFSR